MKKLFITSAQLWLCMPTQSGRISIPKSAILFFVFFVLFRFSGIAQMVTDTFSFSGSQQIFIVPADNSLLL